MKITPKNWRDFQHYKDRNPPWIRLHKGLLDNYEFQCLPVASRALAPMLWLLASDHMEGIIDAEPKRLAFRLRMSPADLMEALKPLIDNGFFEPVDADSNVLAECLQPAVPETEAETLQRTEAETETKPRKARQSADASLSVDDLVAEGVDRQHAQDWFKARRDKGAKTLTVTAWQAAKVEAAKAGMSPAEAIRVAAANSWRGFNSSWLKPQARQAATPQDTTAEAMRLLGFHDDEVIDA